MIFKTFEFHNLEYCRFAEYEQSINEWIRENEELGLVVVDKNIIPQAREKGDGRAPGRMLIWMDTPPKPAPRPRRCT